MYPLLCIEDRAHDHKMELPSQMVHLHSMHAIKSGDHRIGILCAVSVISRKDPTEELRFFLCLRLDHVLAVVRIEKELSRPTMTQRDDRVRCDSEQGMARYNDSRSVPAVRNELDEVVVAADAVVVGHGVDAVEGADRLGGGQTATRLRGGVH